MHFVFRVVLLGAVLFGGIAEADVDGTSLLITGSAAQHDRELANTTIAAVARNTGFSVVTQDFTTKEAAAITKCVTAAQAWSCIAPVIRDKRLQQVVVVSFVTNTGPNRDPMIVITEQVIVAQLDVAIGGRRFCMHCTDGDLVKDMTDLTQALLQEVTVRGRRTVVAIHSTPQGARITFDGDPIGPTTDRSISTFPGPHMVVFELEGYQREIRSIDALLDQTLDLWVGMHPVAGSAEDHPDFFVAARARPLDLPSTTWLAPRVMVGLGGLAVVAGAIVLAFDQDPVVKPIGTEQPAYYYDTIEPGISLVLSGVVVGVGGYLWWRYTGSTSTAVPTITPITRGAVMGLAKNF